VFASIINTGHQLLAGITKTDDSLNAPCEHRQSVTTWSGVPTSSFVSYSHAGYTVHSLNPSVQTADVTFDPCGQYEGGDVCP